MSWMLISIPTRHLCLVVIILVLSICNWFVQHASTRNLIQSKGSVTLGFVQSIGDAGTLTLKEQAIISRRAHNAADDRGKERDHEIVVGCCEDLSAIEDGRKQARTKVSSGVNSLVLLALS